MVGLGLILLLELKFLLKVVGCVVTEAVCWLIQCGYACAMLESDSAYILLYRSASDFVCGCGGDGGGLLLKHLLWLLLISARVPDYRLWRFTALFCLSFFEI